MPKFIVTVRHSVSYQAEYEVEVEADDESLAIEAAETQARTDIGGADTYDKANADGAVRDDFEAVDWEEA